MKLFPQPLVSLAITLLWLVLTSFTPGQLVLGLMVGAIAGAGFGRLTDDRIRVRKPHLLALLGARVFLDIIRSNYRVATLILLDRRSQRRQSGFVHVPLSITNRNALAVLAIVITSTPGTAWLELHPEDNVLLLHVFDLKDDDDWAATIKTRYEPLLKEIFP